MAKMQIYCSHSCHFILHPHFGFEPRSAGFEDQCFTVKLCGHNICITFDDTNITLI